MTKDPFPPAGPQNNARRATSMVVACPPPIFTFCDAIERMGGHGLVIALPLTMIALSHHGLAPSFTCDGTSFMTLRECSVM